MLVRRRRTPFYSHATLTGEWLDSLYKSEGFGGEPTQADAGGPDSGGEPAQEKAPGALVGRLGTAERSRFQTY
jgi:hypothetical protein